MNTRLLLASALAAAAIGGPSLLAQAQTPATPTLTEAQIKAGFTPENLGHGVAKPTAYTAEKCYGIAKAGLNDCSARGSHSCSGTAKIDNDPFSWIYVPAGYCERISGSSMTPPAA